MTKKPAAKEPKKSKGSTAAAPADAKGASAQKKAPDKKKAPERKRATSSAAASFMEDRPSRAKASADLDPAAVERARQKAAQADRDRVALGLKQIGIARASIDVRDKDIVIIFTRLQVPTMRVR